MEIKEADWFPSDYVSRMTLEHEGVTYYWRGEQGEWGTDEKWFDSNENRVEQPEFAEDLDLFDLCDTNAKPWIPYLVREELEQILKLLWGGSETENIEAHNRLAQILKEKVNS